MEQDMGSESIHGSGSVDKTRILTIKPLRYLVPMFPPTSGSSSFSSPQSSASFVCAPPTGPFPPGLSPFYPQFFSNSQQTRYGVDSRIQSSGHFSSLRKPGSNGHARGSRRRSVTRGGDEDESSDGDFEDGTRKRKVGRPRGSKNKMPNDLIVKMPSPEVNIDALANSFLSLFDLSGFTSTLRDEGNRDCVGFVLMVYDLLRRKIPQLDNLNDVSQRPDLKAGATLMTKGIRTNAKKRVGSVPGVEVGDIFFIRMELCVIGLHAPSMAGIDFLDLKTSADEYPLAISIVSSSGYEDDDDDDDNQDGDVLIYSIQGGNTNSDEKLEKGNLAMEKSLQKGNEIRVIRGLKDLVNPTEKVYMYDGLYRIHESWMDKGKLGHNVLKYKLLRISNQPEAFTSWKSIQLWKDHVSARTGVILSDLSSGFENYPVSLFNDVDNEKGPAYFTYYPSLKYGKPFTLSKSSQSCNCKEGCQSSNAIANCSCFEKNESNLPYTSMGVVLSINSMIYECGPSCLCPPNCRNRLSQAGLKVRLEVFKTNDRGWGLRSWDPIRAGSFICEYAGEVIDESNMVDDKDDYFFDTARSYEPPEFTGGISSGDFKIPFPLVISSKNAGNVARFMNHGCDPNVYWQPVVRENGNECYVHVAFFAVRHIPPMKELTFHYGLVRSGEDDEVVKKKCFCGSSKCKGYYY